MGVPGRIHLRACLSSCSFSSQFRSEEQAARKDHFLLLRLSQQHPAVVVSVQAGCLFFPYILIIVCPGAISSDPTPTSHDSHENQPQIYHGWAPVLGCIDLLMLFFLPAVIWVSTCCPASY